MRRPGTRGSSKVRNNRDEKDKNEQKDDDFDTVLVDKEGVLQLMVCDGVETLDGLIDQILGPFLVCDGVETYFRPIFWYVMASRPSTVP